jgi:hypothetical protein
LGNTSWYCGAFGFVLCSASLCHRVLVMCV